MKKTYDENSKQTLIEKEIDEKIIDETKRDVTGEHETDTLTVDEPVVEEATVKQNKVKAFFAGIMSKIRSITKKKAPAEEKTETIVEQETETVTADNAGGSATVVKKRRIKHPRILASVLSSIGAVILALVITVLCAFYAYTDKGPFTNYSDGQFRNALSVSPFTAKAFDEGYTYKIGDKTISIVKELEQYYMSIGATEMYTRIATKRHVTDKDITYGKEDTNANIHTLDQGLELCRLSAELNIPINPEIMCAYTYMDVENAQAPNFEEYPEIYAMQNGKDWSELTLDEMLPILEVYGKFVATEILNTGCTVNCWNIGNEANFGFAGVGIGIKTAVNPKLEGVGFGKYINTIFNKNWFVNNLWKHNAKQMAAVQKGILSAYSTLGKSSDGVQFSTHIATVLATPGSCVKYFNTLKDNGFKIDVAGISFYPSAPAIYPDSMILFKKVVTEIYNKCDFPVFIAEFAYPSGEMSGPYAGWNKKCGKYAMDEQGQKKIFDDVMSWGRTHGVIGLRYWAADYEHWGTMGMFNFENKIGTPKEILKDK